MINDIIVGKHINIHIYVFHKGYIVYIVYKNTPRHFGLRQIRLYATFPDTKFQFSECHKKGTWNK